jgi:hypothetical protein
MSDVQLGCYPFHHSPPDELRGILCLRKVQLNLIIYNRAGDNAPLIALKWNPCIVDNKVGNSIYGKSKKIGDVHSEIAFLKTGVGFFYARSA